MNLTNNQEPITSANGGSAYGGNNQLPRPPIVVVMGHVDHGKTTLLDYIRKTNVAVKEAGGITQSIGAYQITHNQKLITFIDTPGHEAFSKMRERGADAADLAILVVAADDGVKPQTKESINILRESKTPFVATLNKIDKNNADIERVKQELAQAGVLLEGYGGNISWQGISAKTGEGINELLDLILLAADVEGLSWNPEAPASGFIIEAKMDPRRGQTAMAIVKNGILKLGDFISTPTAKGKIKILENFLGERTGELQPSSPALILGFENLPEIGEEFHAGSPGSLIKTNMATNITNTFFQAPKTEIRKISAQISENSRVVNLMLKADVAGSLEAVKSVLETLPEAKIISGAVGDITDGDVKNAQSMDAAITGFNVKISKPAENLAKQQGVKIITSAIIYELHDEVKNLIESLQKPAPLAELEILAVFSRKGRRQVVGGRVKDGILTLNAIVKIIRGENELGSGKILNLQKVKKDAKKAEKDEECGLLIDSDAVIAAGDRLIHEA